MTAEHRTIRVPRFLITSVLILIAMFSVGWAVTRVGETDITGVTWVNSTNLNSTNLYVDNIDGFTATGDINMDSYSIKSDGNVFNVTNMSWIIPANVSNSPNGGLIIETNRDIKALKFYPDDAHGYSQIQFYPERNLTRLTGGANNQFAAGDVNINVHRTHTSTGALHQHLSIYTTNHSTLSDFLVKRLDIPYNQSIANWTIQNSEIQFNNAWFDSFDMGQAGYGDKTLNIYSDTVGEHITLVPPQLDFSRDGSIYFDHSGTSGGNDWWYFRTEDDSGSLQSMLQIASNLMPNRVLITDDAILQISGNATQPVTCGGAYDGAMFYNSTENKPMYCNTTDWVYLPKLGGKMQEDIDMDSNNITTVDCITFASGGQICSGS